MIRVSEPKRTLEGCLAEISPGEVQVFLCARVLDTLSLIEETGLGDRPLVVQLWHQLPQPNQLTADVLQTLAEAAYGLWPGWYGWQGPFLEGGDAASAETILLNRFKCLDLKKKSQDICLPWLKQVVQVCQARKVPLLSEFSRALQLSQLLLAIAPGRATIAIVVADPNPANHQLLGLAQSVRWIADKTQASIALMLSNQLATAPELDSILYGQVSLSAVPSAGDTETLVNLQKIAEPEERGEPEEAKHVLIPVVGRPHPFSPGEKLLAERLAKDAELGPLFQFNQAVRTVYNSTYLIDLLWAGGQVVIEVDGYRYHSNKFAFSRDRHRDYELLLSGYVVLRLPHDEVVSDVEITVEKIRNVVQFRRRNHPCI